MARCYSLNRRLGDKKVELMEAIRDVGIDGTMQLYGIKHRPNFIKWLKKNLEMEWSVNPLANFKAGAKSMWMREHRQTILDCLEIFGRDWVITNFCFEHDTLDRFIDGGHQPFLGGGKLTRLERAELDAREALRIARDLKKAVDLFQDRFNIVDEERRAERGTVIELQRAYGSFTNTVSAQLSQGIGGFIKGMLERGLTLDEALLPPPEPDLNVESVTLEAERKQAEKEEERARLRAEREAREKAEQEAKETQRIEREQERVMKEAEAAEKAQEVERLAREQAELYTREQPLIKGGSSVKVAYLSAHPLANNKGVK